MEFDSQSIQSGFSGSSGVRLFERPGSDIRLKGHLIKLKTMKRKFFVLRSTSSSGPARLEYFDSEKKFNNKQQPKRSIHLHTCFNINRKSDSRHKNAIALYTKDECFSVICDDEKEMESWLQLMLEYQNEYVNENEKTREHYDFVWQVIVQPKGLGQSMNIKGSYRLCMSCHHISLVKQNTEKPHYDFHLETIRSLAHSDNLFRMEVGKIAPTGEGELWMQAEDAPLAQNLHETILNFMKNNQEIRPRASTASEGIRPDRSSSRLDRPVSMHANPVRSVSHSAMLSSVSPGSSPQTLIHSCEQGLSHRVRSDSQGSRKSHKSVVSDDFTQAGMFDFVTKSVEEEDWDNNDDVDEQLVSSPSAEAYVDMTSVGSATPPTPSNLPDYVAMTPTQNITKEMYDGSTYMAMSQPKTSSAPISITTGPGDASQAYTAMNQPRTSSAPIAIISGCGDAGQSYIEMISHNSLPTVKESTSSEGYLPMSPSYSASSANSSSHLRPDRVVCMLSDDSTDFQTQAPTRTYSLGSRPVKTTQTKYSGYMDMSGRKGVSDNGRSCSAPHLNPHSHHLAQSQQQAARSSHSSANLGSPTPSTSPLSTSIRSDDSDSFMELDFCRPRTASDSYSYRPRASSFGMGQKKPINNQGHRPRSSSHGQGTRPLPRPKTMLDPTAPSRLGHDLMLTRSQISSHGSFDSMKLSSNESLRKHSQELRTKISELSSDYVDMGFEKRHTPSPQPPSGRPGHGSYVDMNMGHRNKSPNRSRIGSKSNSMSGSAEKLQQDSDYTEMKAASGADSVYINIESQEKARKQESPSTSSAPTVSSNLNAAVTASMQLAGYDSRNRSGSGGKEQKRRNVFLSRAGQSESSKSNRKLEQSTAGLNLNYSSTGGDKFGSLGRNIRQKSKESMDSGRSGGRKAHSFSHNIGITASRPGKLVRKTHTPPKSLDGNDEYVEFAPVATKAVSDFFHSSGNTFARPKSKSECAKDSAEYVGFEPGYFTVVSPSRPAAATSANNPYTSMNTHGIRSAHKSVPSDDRVKTVQMGLLGETDKSKTKFNSCNSAAPSPFDAVDTESGGGAQFKTREQTVPRCEQTVPRCEQTVPRCEQTVPRCEQTVQRCEQTVPRCEQTVPRCHSAALPDLPPIPDPLADPPLPVPQLPPLSLQAGMYISSQDRNDIITQGSQDRNDIITRGSSSQDRNDIITQGSSSQDRNDIITRGSTSQDRNDYFTAGSSSQNSSSDITGKNVYAVSDCLCQDSAPDHSSMVMTQLVDCTFSPLAATLHLSVVPSKVPSSSQTACSELKTVKESVSVTGSSISTANLPQTFTKTVTESASVTGSSTSTANLPQTFTSVSSSVSSVSSSSALQQTSPDSVSSSNSCCVLMAKASLSGKDDNGYMDFDPGTPRLSASSGTPSLPNCPLPVAVPMVVEGGDGGATGVLSALPGNGRKPPKALEVENPTTSPRLCEGTGRSAKVSPCGGFETKPSEAIPLASSVTLPALTRPDSSPDMVGMDRSAAVGRGRGRHASSSSTQGRQGKKGGGSCGDGRDGCLVPKAEGGGSPLCNPIVNTDTEARHSITDLSGYEVMSFPSNALCQQQQSGVVVARQPNPLSVSLGSGSGSISGSQGLLNYATLDLSSTDSVSDSTDSTWSPRNKSRHTSSVDEKNQPLSYATIDFEKSESLREKAEILRTSVNKETGKRNS